MTEQEFLDIFYRPFAQKLLSYALNLTLNKQDAEDLLQDTFTKAWRSLNTYNKNQSMPQTWLATIMRNTYLTGRQKNVSTTELIVSNDKADDNTQINEQFEKFPSLFKKYYENDYEPGYQLLFKLYAINGNIATNFELKEKTPFDENFFTPNPTHHKRILYRLFLMKKFD